MLQIVALMWLEQTEVPARQASLTSKQAIELKERSWKF
jgi:hypothetical protein